MEKLQEKRPPARAMRILKDYIKKEIGWEGVDWIDLAQTREKYGVSEFAVMESRVP